MQRISGMTALVIFWAAMLVPLQSAHSQENGKLVVVHVIDFELPDGARDHLAQMRLVSASGEVTWKANAWPSYPMMASGRYRTARIGNVAITHIPHDADERYYRADLDQNTDATQLEPDHPLINQATEEDRWSPLRTMEFDPPVKEYRAQDYLEQTGK